MQAANTAHAEATLRRLLTRGSTLYCIEERSRTNGTGYLRCYAIDGDKLVGITYYVHLVTGTAIKDREGAIWLKLGYCGYSRSEYLAGELANALGYGADSTIIGETL